MNCPKCNTDTRVIDSRPHESGWRRRRACMAQVSCGFRFTTYECIEGNLSETEVLAVARAVIDLETTANWLARARKALHVVGHAKEKARDVVD